MKSSTTLTARIPRVDAEAVERLAERRGVSRSWLVRTLIGELVRAETGVRLEGLAARSTPTPETAA